MSADWSAASCLTRRLTRLRSTTTLVASSPSATLKFMPSSGASATSAISSEVAISVLLGTQSVTTADPPIPSESTRAATSAPSWEATQRRPQPPGPPPTITTGSTVPSPTPSPPPSHRAPVSATTSRPPCPDAAPATTLDPARMAERCPHSPLRGAGWLEGWPLTFAGEELGWHGAMATIVEDPFEQVFVAVYDVTDEDVAALDQWESVDTGLFRQVRVRVSVLTGEVVAWMYVLDAFEGGLPSASYLGVLVRRRGGRRRAGRLRRRTASASAVRPARRPPRSGVRPAVTLQVSRPGSSPCSSVHRSRVPS